MHPNWPMESSSTEVRKPPQWDAMAASSVQQQKLEYSSRGDLLLKRGEELGDPISGLYDPEVPGSYFAYLRKLAAHRLRMRKEMSANQKGEIARTAVRPAKYKDIKNKRLGRKKTWQSLKVVSCAGCKKMLLGESEESFREELDASHPKDAKNLPPPIVLRTDWGPWCRECVRNKRAR